MDSLQLLGQKKKCLVMISWHFLDDFVEDIFGFSVNSSDDIYNHFYGGDTLEKSVRQLGVFSFADRQLKYI